MNIKPVTVIGGLHISKGIKSLRVTAGVRGYERWSTSTLAESNMTQSIRLWKAGQATFFPKRALVADDADSPVLGIHTMQAHFISEELTLSHDRYQDEVAPVELTLSSGVRLK